MTAGQLADPFDVRYAARATGLLAEFNRTGVLSSADVHVATALGRLGGESDQQVVLAVALAVRAVRYGSVCVDLGQVRTTCSSLSPPSRPSAVATCTSALLSTPVRLNSARSPVARAAYRTSNGSASCPAVMPLLHPGVRTRPRPAQRAAARRRPRTGCRRRAASTAPRAGSSPGTRPRRGAGPGRTRAVASAGSGAARQSTAAPGAGSAPPPSRRPAPWDGSP